MTWFKVDDRLHAHPKALATSLAALGLWTVAGSWSSDHLTDGFMPDHVIPLLSRGTSELADELVAAGLWRRVRGGYRFHQWDGDGHGNRRNPTKKEVVDIRKKRAEAGRKGGLSSGNTRSKREAKSKQVLQQNGSTRTLPVPRPMSVETKGGEGTHDPPEGVPPPRRCKLHERWPDDAEVPPCGACADARRAHAAWQRQHTQPAEHSRPNPLDGQQAAAMARAQRHARAMTGEACPTCDDTGWTTDEAGNATPCSHTPESV